MPLEIERKFLVKSQDYKLLAIPIMYSQGYLAILPDREVRVRKAGNRNFITIKIRINDTSRHEFEYPVPAEDADFMLQNLCVGPVVEKLRYRIPQRDLSWEVDEFTGANAGLVIAEIELPDSDYTFEKPGWVGEEVTGDDRYLNAALALNPYKNWQNEAK